MTTLEKIRAEIEKLRPNLRPEQMTDYDYAMADVFNDIVAIIDKYADAEPSEDAVSRQAVYEILEGNWNTDFLHSEIEQLPSVQPKAKTGIWEFAYRFHRKCSVCGEVVNISEDDNYCHKCGAKMEREPNDHLSQF